ncbi:MAG: hypothetical protein KGN16_17635 [Burkholderiales bacterium]|nr:hypothetical protein [Burkholderiales bacterium]
MPPKSTHRPEPCPEGMSNPPAPGRPRRRRVLQIELPCEERVVCDERPHDEPPCDCDCDRDCDDGSGGGGGGGQGGPRDDCGGPIPNPGRPGRPQPPSTGRSDDPTPLTPGDLQHPNPPGVWGGPRKDLFLPFLFLRAFPGDTGTRPVAGPFWESPDIFIVPGVDPALAPAVPAQFGDTALAHQPNTLYAHVWNLGQSAAAEVVVEFYWVDPSLGVGPANAHLIAQTMVSLGSRGSARAHAVVKCPVAWVPDFLNGGHECLLVRVWDNSSDLPGAPMLDARVNRHVGQRNIHVVDTPLPALMALMAERAMAAPRGLPTPALPSLRLLPRRPALPGPVILRVGPLFGQPALVRAERVAPHQVAWLQLRTGQRGRFPVAAPATGALLLSRAASAGDGFVFDDGADHHCVSGDDRLIAFSTGDDAPGPGEAHVYRISASQGGVLFGGYTICVMGRSALPA